MTVLGALRTTHIETPIEDAAVTGGALLASAGTWRRPPL